MHNIRQTRLAGRERGDRRVRGVTGWSAAAAGLVSAVFSVLLATQAPATAAAAPSDVAGGGIAPDVPPAAGSWSGSSTDQIPDTGSGYGHRRHSSDSTLRAPAEAPSASQGGGAHARSGAS